MQKRNSAFKYQYKHLETPGREKKKALRIALHPHCFFVNTTLFLFLILNLQHRVSANFQCCTKPNTHLKFCSSEAIWLKYGKAPKPIFLNCQKVTGPYSMPVLWKAPFLKGRTGRGCNSADLHLVSVPWKNLKLVAWWTKYQKEKMNSKGHYIS